MHGNDKVLSFTENAKGYVESVVDVYNNHLLPFQCNTPNHYQFKLQQWFLESKSSMNREDINTLFSFYGKDFVSPPNFVSLLNNYWIRNEKDTNITWDKTNPYDNWNPQEDIIDILLNSPHLLESNIPITFNSPNMTLPGFKERYWYKEDNKFYLLEKKTKKSQYPIVIYEQQLFTKRIIPFVNKEYEFMPLSFYIDTIEDENMSDFERIKTVADKYQLDKSQIAMNRLTETYLIRDAKSLFVTDTIIL